MGECGKESFIEFRQVKGREFAAAGKAMFVNGATVFVQEVTGDGVDDHHIVAGARFDIFFFQFGIGCMEVGGQCGYFIFGDVDHEVAAAISTCSTVYLRSDDGIQFPDKLICFAGVLALQE